MLFTHALQNIKGNHDEQQGVLKSAIFTSKITQEIDVRAEIDSEVTGITKSKFNEERSNKCYVKLKY